MGFIRLVDLGYSGISWFVQINGMLHDTGPQCFSLLAGFRLSVHLHILCHLLEPLPLFLNTRFTSSPFHLKHPPLQPYCSHCPLLERQSTVNSLVGWHVVKDKGRAPARLFSLPPLVQAYMLMFASRNHADSKTQATSIKSTSNPSCRDTTRSRDASPIISAIRGRRRVSAFIHRTFLRAYSHL